MNLLSPAFIHNDPIPSKYTCDGENVSPPLTISDIPEAAKSLVLIVDDPDAPRGNWLHWTIWNMDPAMTEIAERSSPGTEGNTDFGKTGYGGPCPPSGTHRYVFKLYALDTMLDLPQASTKMELNKAMEGHVLTQTELIGMYQRK